MNKILVTLIFCVMYVFNVHCAMADVGCTASPSPPIIFNLSSIAVSQSLPVSSDIPGSIHSVTFSGNCNAPDIKPLVSPGMPIIACYFGVGAELASMPGVYDSGVPGIGIAMKNSLGQRIVGAGVGCDTRNTPLGTLDSSLNFSYSVSLSLVKVNNNVSPGTLILSNTVFGMGVYNTGVRIGNGENTVSYSGDITIRSSTCSVLSSSINVSLGAHSETEFSGKGSTTKASPFSINLKCDKDSDVNVRIDGSKDVDGGLSVLALTKSNNSASGVGAQILRNGTPIVLGQEMQINASTSEGPLSIPFTARYYQTQDNVEQGVANAVATFTMIYY